MRRVSRRQPAVLPAGAEQDASKATTAIQEAAKAEAQAQQIDPQLLAGFQPYVRSFQVAAGSAPPIGRPASPTGAEQETTTAGKQQQQQAQEEAVQQQQQGQQQQVDEQPALQTGRSRAAKRDFIELFAPKPTPQGSPQVCTTPVH